jgi:hypothetical protein
METAPEDEVIVRYDKFKLVRVVIVILAFCGMGVWLLVMPQRADGHPSLLLRLFGFAMALAFGGFGFLFMHRLFRDPAVLIIDRQGFDDHTDLTHLGRVSWSEIRGARVVTRTRWLRGLLPSARRRHLGLSTGLESGPIMLDVAGLDVTADDLAEIINRHVGHVR